MLGLRVAQHAFRWTIKKVYCWGEPFEKNCSVPIVIGKTAIAFFWLMGSHGALKRTACNTEESRIMNLFKGICKTAMSGLAVLSLRSNQSVG